MMRTRGEKVQAETLVEEAFASVVYFPSTNGRPAAETNWEDGLTDFEWIEFWASLTYGDMTDCNSPTTVKH